MESREPLAIVHDQLQAYARRGVFRSFSPARSQGGQTDFRFHWLWNLPFCLTFDARRKALGFRNLLPDVPARSELNSELKAFIRSCCSDDLPEHRRIDPRRLAVRYSNLRGRVSLSFVVRRGEYEYGVGKALNLVNEILVGFLNVRFPEYTARRFHKRED